MIDLFPGSFAIDWLGSEERKQRRSKDPGSFEWLKLEERVGFALVLCY